MSVTDDPDMQKAPAALLRAAQRARKIAQQTGTAIIVVRDGQLVREIPSADEKLDQAIPALVDLTEEIGSYDFANKAEKGKP